MTYNIVAILNDGRTITGQAEGFKAAAVEVMRWSRNSLFTPGRTRVVRVFLGHEGGSDVMEYGVNELAREVGLEWRTQ